MELHEKDFPGNSKTKKPKVQKVVETKVRTRKKPLGRKFADAMLGDDMNSLGDYIIHDVVIPTAKNMAEDIITTTSDALIDTLRGVLEISLYGERKTKSSRRRTRRSGSGTYVSYNNAYNSNYRSYSKDRNESQKRRTVKRKKTDLEDIVFEDKASALKVLGEMFDLVNEYGSVTLYELYDLCGITSAYTDKRRGWTDLTEAYVERDHGDWIIVFPKLEVM